MQTRTLKLVSTLRRDGLAKLYRTTHVAHFNDGATRPSSISELYKIRRNAPYRTSYRPQPHVLIAIAVTTTAGCEYYPGNAPNRV